VPKEMSPYSGFTSAKSEDVQSESEDTLSHSDEQLPSDSEGGSLASGEMSMMMLDMMKARRYWSNLVKCGRERVIRTEPKKLHI